MEVTNTVIVTDKVARAYKLAVCADLHNRKGDKALEILSEVRPDAVLIPGDLMHNLDNVMSLKRCKNSLKFLRECADIAPTLYAIGNHEKKVTRQNRKEIEKTGSVMLLGEVVRIGEISVGGITPSHEGARLSKTPKPKLLGACRLQTETGFRILLSHHPEHFVPYLKDKDIDLVISGHAHGGQWRFFGRGVFAPGQGIFPKYTSGLYHGKLYVSRGMSNTVAVPRINNECELAIIEIKPKEKA